MNAMNSEAAQLWENAAQQMPGEIVEKINTGMQRMIDGETPYSPLAVGQTAPAFTLNNFDGTPRALSEYLAKGPLVLFFFRGDWCPFCNIQLKHYQDNLVEFAKYGAQLVAVSPEKPDHSTVMAEKHRLTFDVLYDVADEVGEAFGVTLRVPSEHEEVLTQLGVPLTERNGTANWTLPVPGVFVIGQDGKIASTFVNPNYRIRAEPEEIIAALATL
ncbi:hypothetical protein ACMU_06955 [Actibacterium mucosum KCTC 23349]|uniref:thioredoxin-dependent peroxiredoxin n=1 Tax=Actibacterium mucosum KCTC 23349 TaxID=1454373 RepID=A0A037ZKP3_9RHOB|nr:peroxiredoxin-like family protein [Actibacterium mucosum]KAJ56673.1 hypothetical protein ACMU_06955 [Actibacterium mucosum KCTC 23349]